MNYSRRNFIKLTGGAATGLALGSMTGISLLSCTEKAAVTNTFGLQLYTLRDVLPQDPKGILKQVASFGYKQIESYDEPQRIFWSMGHTGFKKYMDDLGMTLVAAHCDINKEFEQRAAEAAAIGMKFLLCPWLGPQPTLDDYKRQADVFNARGEVCKKNGIRFAYHNHDYSFLPVDGQYPQDILMSNTDPALVHYVLAIYLIVNNKQNPIE